MPSQFLFSSLKFEKTQQGAIYSSADFSYIVFHWEKTTGPQPFYLLKGTSYNSLGVQISKFSLAEINGPKVPLKSEALGVLVLSKNDMTQNGMTGNADAFFHPKPFGAPREYVFYNISDSVNPNNIAGFALNPSPPR